MTHHRDQSRTVATLSVSGHSQGPLLEKTVDTIEKSVDTLITDAPISSNEQFHAVRPIAKSIEKAYNHARAELLASPREERIPVQSGELDARVALTK